MESIVDWIRSKRNGDEVPETAFTTLINGYTLGKISDAQMGAFLMAGVCNGFSDAETVSITRAMHRCGERLDLSGLDKPKVDCYSTGGVGDKTPLVAASIAAAAGVAVPMIVEHGTGHTIGLLDKLQAIPGLRSNLEVADFADMVTESGLAFAEQSNSLAPAEKRLYDLRDRTATVESLPLIAASAMSKKLAEHLDGLIVDIKIRRGSLISGKTEARRLAQQLMNIGRKFDISVQAFLTSMEQPLGYTVGNALEIMEVSQTLQGAGPEDVHGLAVEIAARMIFLGDTTFSIDSARQKAQELIDDRSALQALATAVAAQGGDAEALTDFNKLPLTKGALAVTSPRDGYVSKVGSDEIGRAATLLGAGRNEDGTSIDPAVGLVLEAKVGQPVVNGSRLCSLYYNDEENLEEAQSLVEDAFRISAKAPEPTPILIDLIQG